MYSWVGNIASVSGGKPHDMICPSNPLQGSEALSDMCDYLDWSGAESIQFLNRSGPMVIESITQQNSRVVQTWIRDKGLNTNYASSWFMVRGQLVGPPIDGTPNPGGGPGFAWLYVDCDKLIRPASWPYYEERRTKVTGPLTQHQLSYSTVPASNIPLLGDASAGDEILTDADHLNSQSSGVTSLDPQGRLRDGTQLAVSSGAGPAYFGSSNGVWKIPQFKDGLSVDDAFLNDGVTPLTASHYSPQNGYYQDTRCWVATHRNSANLLMADGSVKTLADINGDSYFNPGFTNEGTGFPQFTAENSGYSSNLKEIDDFHVYSGVWLADPEPQKDSFE